MIRRPPRSPLFPYPPLFRSPVRGAPAGAGGIAEAGAAVAANPLDRQPLERRPAVGGVPLLTRGDQGRDKPAGLQEIALQARGDGTSLLRRRQPKVQRSGGSQGGTVRHALARPPPHIVEESACRIIRSEERRVGK